MFVHLHCHSCYSLLDGLVRVKDMVKAAKDMEMPAVALTDHGVMYGVIEFYKAAREEGINPIIGCEVYVAPRTRFDKKPKKDENPFHLVLLAKDREGYENLMKIVSLSFLEGFYYKPRVDFQLLEENRGGLIALSGCMAGEIPRLVQGGKIEEARELALKYQQTFGEQNFYLEIQQHFLPEQKIILQGLGEISRDTGIPLVATNDSHYMKREDATVQDVLLCIQTGKSVEVEERLKFTGNEFYFKSPVEMGELFSDYPQALENTLRIASQCQLEFDFNQTHLPYYRVPRQETQESYLEKLCYQGLKDRFGEITPGLESRLKYELGVIIQMGYASYFLIVWDFVRFARDNKILVGPGRGSAAGSLVAYCLFITDIDPLKYGLLFERFLNPERVSMPDIDIDFCFEGREKVIDYVVEKYGEEQVAQIITFGTMAARAAVRDVGRALNMPYGEVDKIAKLIPAELGITIEKALQFEELKDLREKDGRVKKLLDMSRSIEGLPRHSSVHAAGVVIARESLVRHVPLQKLNDSGVVTQFPMKTLEDLGLLKMDFLGLRTLTIMQGAIDLVEYNTGEIIDLQEIPLGDTRTYEMLSQGNTAGVFQLESSGMRGILRELKPNKFEDIIAVVALYRPGPMEQIPTFIQSKHGQKPIKYLHPRLEPFLKETYGVMVYQEQIMQVAAEMAGFSLGQADILRRAIGKKMPEILAQQREIFVQGCQDRGYPQKLANQLYDLIVKFADYGFNKSHAAAYAMIAYQTAYLKANYPLEFMAALLTGVMSNTDKVAHYVNDSKRQGLEILPPDINQCFASFTVVEKKIRFGLAAVKNVGQTAIDSIIENRERVGHFKSLRHFCNEVDLRVCNKKVIESLVRSGAFDSLGAHRSQLLAVLDDTVAMAQSYQKEKQDGQVSMFDLLAEAEGTGIDRGGGNGTWEIDQDVLPEVEEVTNKEKLSWEKELLGLYISGHPLDSFRDVLESGTQTVNNLASCNNQQKVTLGGIIHNLKPITTKKGKNMSFFTLEDLGGEIEVVVFPELYEESKKILENEKVVKVTGKLDRNSEEETKIIAERINLLEAPAAKVYLKINEGNASRLEDLRDILLSRQGNLPVYFCVDNGDSVMAGNDFWIPREEIIISRIKILVGENNFLLEDR